ncbi:hypothetical protein [Sphingobacterium multivorum]|uniref:hypothetical protein n=1 Tax=Sphingobacterium multivorum TaxID=28454 RepID=UPI003017820A
MSTGTIPRQRIPRAINDRWAAYRSCPFIALYCAKLAVIFGFRQQGIPGIKVLMQDLFTNFISILIVFSIFVWLMGDTQRYDTQAQEMAGVRMKGLGDD